MSWEPDGFPKAGTRAVRPPVAARGIDGKPRRMGSRVRGNGAAATAGPDSGNRRPPGLRLHPQKSLL